jgi:hypothetical protein
MSGSKALAVLATLVFCSSAFGADEWPISKIRMGAPADTVSDANAAGNGDLFLMHWRDYRGGGSSPRDFVVRVDAAGRILDDIDIAVPLNDPAVLPLGDGFLLVDGNEWLTVSRDGTLSAVQKVSPRTGNQGWASNGTLVFRADTYSVSVYDASMHLLADKRLSLPLKNTYRFGPVVATAGGVAIAYSDSDGFHVAFADTQATLKWMVTPAPDFSSVLRLATDGTRVFAIADFAGFQVMGGWLIEPDGSISVRTNVAYNSIGSLGWNGKWVWVRDETDAQKKRNLVASTFENGLWSAPTTLIDYVYSYPPKRVITTRGMLDIEATTIATYAGLTLTNRLVTTTRGAVPQQFPRTASTAAATLAIWSEKHPRNSGSSVLGTRLAPNGTPIDVDSITIADDICADARPLIAAGKGQFLVAWLGSNGVRAARVSESGNVLDKVPLSFPPETNCVYGRLYGLVAAGDTYLVAWEGWPPRFARIGADGTILDPGGVAIGPSFGPPANFSSVVSNGSQFLVAWWQNNAATNGPYTFGMAVQPSGVPVFPTLNLAPGTLGALTWDGRQYFALQKVGSAWHATLIPPSLTPVEVPLTGDPLPETTWSWDLGCGSGCELVAGISSPLELVVRPIATDGSVRVFAPTFALPLDEAQRWFFQGKIASAATFGHPRRFAAYTRIDSGLGAVPRIYITPLIPARHRATRP